MSVIKKSVVKMSVAKMSVLVVAKRTEEHLRSIYEASKKTLRSSKQDWLLSFFSSNILPPIGLLGSSACFMQPNLGFRFLRYFLFLLINNFNCKKV